ncbi:hypothetical protein ACFYKX_10075 [Cytobacillus sp. FJAT-54145]|uniref:Uncharacterized protein n=1 Tax=Cytobacillus spartinae TaxID=3299023 RepID=A0ABW6K9S3_9BACI
MNQPNHPPWSNQPPMPQPPNSYATPQPPMPSAPPNPYATPHPPNSYGQTPPQNPYQSNVPPQPSWPPNPGYPQPPHGQPHSQWNQPPSQHQWNSHHFQSAPQHHSSWDPDDSYEAYESYKSPAPSPKTIFGGCLTFIVLILMLGGCTALFFGGDEESDEPKTEEILNLSNEEFAKKVVEQTKGKKTNTGLSTLNEINEHDGYMNIWMNADETFTTEAARGEMLRGSAEIFQELFKKESIEKVDLIWQLPMTDAYGNVETRKVLQISLDRSINEKINWESFYVGDFETITEVWMHPALREE